MTVDFTEEFRDFDQAKFDSATDRQDYIHHKVVEGLSGLIDQTMFWLDIHVKTSRWEDSQAERRFYEALVIEVFSHHFVMDGYTTFMRERIARVTDENRRMAGPAGEC